jgi:hypothetical protein
LSHGPTITAWWLDFTKTTSGTFLLQYAYAVVSKRACHTLIDGPCGHFIDSTRSLT